MLLLSKNGSLPIKYNPHKLSGNYQDCWECHIKPNWLLVWKQDDTALILLFTNTGTNSDLF
jgi:mRNA interferase YafQ